MILCTNFTNAILGLSQGMGLPRWDNDDRVWREGLPLALSNAQAAGSTKHVVDRDCLEGAEPEAPSALNAAHRERAEPDCERNEETVEKICPHGP